MALIRANVSNKEEMQRSGQVRENVRTSVMEWIWGRDQGIAQVSELSDCMLVSATFLFIEVENFEGERGFVR